MTIYDNQASPDAKWLYFSLLAIFLLAVSVGCRSSSAGVYSIQEQYALSATRSSQMSNQLEFSLRLTSDKVPFEQDIQFVATFTNTTEHPIVFREPRQQGVIEISDVDTTLLFAVEPISVNISFQYPRYAYSPDILVWPPVKQDEFITLLPHGARETRLKLPRLVLRNGEMGKATSLPVGQYLVHMTYNNSYIGYEIQRDEEKLFVDVGAWVGQVKSNTVVLTITP